MKGGAILLVAFSLFWVGSTEPCKEGSDSTDCKVEQVLERLEQMNETLQMLREVIIALREPIENQTGFCLSHALGIESCTLGSISCSHIDVTMKKAVCVECVKDVSVCKSYGSLTNDIAIKKGGVSIIEAENDDYDLTINKNGTVTFNTLPLGKGLDPSDCSCSWLHYYSEHIDTIKGNSTAPLKCDCNDTKDLFCLDKTCYGQSCSFFGDSHFQCKMDAVVSGGDKKNLTIEFSKTPYNCLPKNCKVVTALQLTYKDIFVENGKYFAILGKNLTEKIGINCAEPLCGGTLDDNCNNTYNFTDNCSVIQAALDNGPKPHLDPPPTSYALYVAIIVVILILFALYVGYQNYQKISECVNGVESEGSQAHSNRRGRMKGKYAPLPRVMEESVTRHND